MTQRALVPCLIVALLACAWLSLAIGSAPVSVFAGLDDWLHARETAAALIVGDVRLPRTVLALLVGACLGLSGAAMQGLLRNPLADPGLVGASQGAALGAAAVFYFGVFASWGTAAPALAGLIGAGIALSLMLLLAGSARPAQLILAGLAISSLSSALLAVVLNFAPNPFAMQELVFWMLGSVEARGLAQQWLLWPALLVGGALVFSQRRLFAALGLGESVAESLGFSVRRGGRIVVLGVALLVGASVSIAGNVGFVGLIVPHLLRRFVAHRPEELLLPSALSGALLVNVADIAVRLLPPGREVKLGVLTSLIGAPLFIHLVWKERRQWP